MDIRPHRSSSPPLSPHAAPLAPPPRCASPSARSDAAHVESPGRVLPLSGTRDIDVPLLQLAAVLADYAGSCAWVADCVESKVLAVGAETLLYNRIRIGRGFDERDVVLTPTLETVRTAGGLGVCSRVVARVTPEVPPPPGCIRMPHLISEIVLEPLDAGRTRARYSASVSPGGWVPKWIVPLVSHGLPRRTLAALARCAATPEYAAAAAPLAASLGWPAMQALI